MKRIKSINKKGICEYVNISDLYLSETLEDIKNNDFSHLLIYDYDQKYKLVIDSFNDKLELVETKFVEYFKDCSFIEEEDIEIMKYYSNIFVSPNNLFGKKILERNYNEVLINNKNHNYFFVICPTYSCNMRCIYCYQQGNKELNKEVISDDNLNKIFSYIRMEAKKIQSRDKNSTIVLELFGGEPIQACNKNILEKIFSFARENKFYVAATTNGTEIEMFYDLFLTYHKYICTIATTIDGTEKYHNSRRISKLYKNNFDKILKNIEFLLDIGVVVELYINLDRDNIEQLREIISLINKKNWTKREKFYLKVGRVDDRLFETNYKSIIKESELLKIIYDLAKEINLPRNLQIAFLKTSLYIAERFNISFNQNEIGRQKYHYCWAASKIQHTIYIDSELNTFRCTYTVGKKELAMGSLNNSMTNHMFDNHNSLEIEKCRKCKIGGYCGGGCTLSYLSDSDRQCSEEFENFNYLINKIIIPMLKGLDED